MLGRRLSARRLFHSLTLCVFVLLVMCYSKWDTIQDSRRPDLIRIERDLSSDDIEDFSYDFTSVSEHNSSLVDQIVEGSSFSGLNDRFFSKKESRKGFYAGKSSFDYGRDRDVDVEGVEDYVMWYENFRTDTPLPLIPRQQKCSKPSLNIAFLKTHYTGSDVITNIFNRLGDLRNLNMALPSDGLSTFYWPMRFQWKYIDITLLNGSLPNIICNHARYNGDVMDNIMTPGSVYVTILRNPTTQLETTFHNLRFAELLGIENVEDTLGTFIANPKVYIQNVIKRKKFKDSLNLIKNGMFFDLGLSTTEYHKKDVIKSTILEIYEKFSIVMIYEYLDESLILMRRRFCLELDDILYLKRHQSLQNAYNREEFSPKLEQLVHAWNTADMELYTFFNDTLWKEISYEGDGFWDELREFRVKLRDIEKDCLGEVQTLDGSGLGQSLILEQGVRMNPNVSDMNNYLCKKLIMSEIEYLDYFRRKEVLSRSRAK